MNRKKCTNCQKGKMTGNLVSHAQNRTKRTFMPNIQKKQVMYGGLRKTVYLCTRCIKRINRFGKIGKYSLPFGKLGDKKGEVKKLSLKDVDLPKQEKLEKPISAEEKREQEVKIEDIVGTGKTS